MTTKKSREEIFAAADKEHEQFQLAIGRLTLAWSDAESALYSVLRYYAGVSDEVARAIFSGTRARQMIDFINAIAENTNLESVRRTDLEEVFAQLKTINTMRDMLIHHVDGSMVQFDDKDPSTRLLSDDRRVSRPAKAKRYLIGSKHINEMCDDLTECCWRLIAHRENTNNPFVRGCGPTGKPHAWVFSPPQPIARKRQE